MPKRSGPHPFNDRRNAGLSVSRIILPQGGHEEYGAEIVPLARMPREGRRRGGVTESPEEDHTLSGAHRRPAIGPPVRGRRVGRALRTPRRDHNRKEEDDGDQVSR